MKRSYSVGVIGLLAAICFDIGCTNDRPTVTADPSAPASEERGAAATGSLETKPPPPSGSAVSSTKAPAVEVLAAGQAGPADIVVTPGAIYWIDFGVGDSESGIVMKLEKKAGSKPIALASKLRAPVGLAADEATVFFLELGPDQSLTALHPVGTLSSVPAAGGAVKLLASKQDHPAAVTVDGGNVYFTNGPLMEGKPSDILRVAKSGGAPKVFASRRSGPSGIVVDAVNAYWVEAPACDKTGSIVAAPLGGGAPKVLAGQVDCPERIAIDDTTVYFVSSSNGDVVALDKKGGEARPIARGRKGARYLAADGKHVYFSDPANGGISRVARGGGDVERVAAATDPSGIAVDEGFIYFSDGKAGTVARRAK